MKITVQQSGGFAGLSKTTSINVTKLPKTKQQQITHIIKEVKFFSLPPVLKGDDDKARDIREYTITCAYNSKTHTVKCTDVTKKPVAPLLAWINVENN